MKSKMQPPIFLKRERGSEKRQKCFKRIKEIARISAQRKRTCATSTEGGPFAFRAKLKRRDEGRDSQKGLVQSKVTEESRKRVKSRGAGGTLREITITSYTCGV